MTKEEFKNKKQDIRGKILKLNKELNEAKHDYITSNQPFEIGDKVAVYRGPQKKIGIVIGFEIGSNHIVKPKLAKCKNDGTASRHELYFFGTDRLELIGK